eukprot:285167-Karenia_brevis.AAC.1
MMMFMIRPVSGWYPRESGALHKKDWQAGPTLELLSEVGRTPTLEMSSHTQCNIPAPNGS